MSTTDPSTRGQRVLACILCQQRKIKCDRKFPCANCNKAQVKCIQAAPTRSRKPRFPERSLLDRIRRYEELLRQNDVKFEPLYKEAGSEKGPLALDERRYLLDSQGHEDATIRSSPSTVAGSERSANTAKDFWKAMAQRSDFSDGSDSNEDFAETTVRNVWDQIFDNEDDLLPGHKTDEPLSTIHPEPVQIFQLWQIYIDNVNSLLKVTHTPSLQDRIIQAATDMANISPTLEALMFGIYSMAVTSLSIEDCMARFGASKDELLRRYHLGSQQALANCGFLRTNDRDCLTAFYLYIISIRPRVHPRSLASLSSIATHIAKRMGIHNEASLASHPFFEAEMRRRLWWSLMMFDSRVSELASSKDTILIPTWNCQVPLNANDSDLRPEMKQKPVQGKSTDALFFVVRSELAEFTRHADFHLDFTQPALKAVAREAIAAPASRSLDSFERMMEEEYLRFCDPEIPLHYLTIWATRQYLSRCRLFEHYAKYADAHTAQPEAARDAAILHAAIILECDHKIFSSPLTKGYVWMFHMYFPAPAYIYILQELRKRPVSKHAARAWAAMSDDYMFRHLYSHKGGNPMFRIFSKMIFQAWDARQEVFGMEDELETPGIVLAMRDKLAHLDAGSIANTQASSTIPTKDFSTPVPMDMGRGFSLGTSGQEVLGMGPGMGLGMALDPSLAAVDMSPSYWTGDWEFLGTKGW